MTKDQLKQYTADLRNTSFRVLVGGKWQYFSVPLINHPMVQPASVGRFSYMYDSQKNPLFEGDIIEGLQDTEFGSSIMVKGVICFNEETGQFGIEIPADHDQMHQFFIRATKKIGDIYTTPQVL